MKVLAISGDRRFKPGNPRYDLQASAVDLTVVYWGWGALFPRIPAGHFDVVSAQDPFFRGVFAWYVAKKLKARFNVQVHTDLSAQPFFKYIIAKRILRRADTIRVVSKKCKGQVERMRVRGRISVLPVFTDLHRFADIVRKPDPHTILWIGRFEVEKNPFYALDVLKHVRKRGVDARLIMLGDGSLRGMLEGKASILSLPVEFPGWQDPTPYLATATLVLSTSIHESWGASLVEALAAGVPVIAPDVGIAREAGAIVVSHEHMPGIVTEALKSGAETHLAITMPSKDEWVKEWITTL